MTVYAHIRTTRALHGYGAVPLNPTSGEMDIWFITISESLSNKTIIEVKNILNIDSYGIWITTPLDNKFWIVSNTVEGFNVQEFASANLDDVYTILEIDEALAEKADIEHTHSSEDIIDLELTIQNRINEFSDDVNLFLDNLTRALINQE